MTRRKRPEDKEDERPVETSRTRERKQRDLDRKQARKAKNPEEAPQ